MSAQTIITTSHLCKAYPLYNNKRDRLIEALDPFHRQRHTLFSALDDISFCVEKGDCVGVIGVNGSGKSTLLKILTGVLTPSSGNVSVQGRVSALLELGAGFHPERTGMENIYFQGTLQGLQKKEIEAYLPKVVEFAEIGKFIHQPVKLYSSGMFVRLAFAAAIQGNPDILIVDEALAVGDIAFQFKCMSKMKSLMNGGVTVLFVSHDMGAVKSLCRSCLYLSRGKVIASGNTAEICEMYLRDQRDAMNQKTAAGASVAGEKAARPKDLGIQHKVDPGFAGRVTRQGTGDVSFTCVEVLDEQQRPLVNVEFDQNVIIRLHLVFNSDCQSHVGYHIRNRLNEEILGTGTGFEETGALSGKPGDCWVVDFTTRVPLLEGAYSVLAVATTRQSDTVFRFNDMVENAAIFQVMRRVPKKIWNAVYLSNTVSTYFAGTSAALVCPLCGREHGGYLPLWKELADNLVRYGFDAETLQTEFSNRNRLTCPMCGGMDRERMCAEYLLRRLGRGFSAPAFRFLEFAPNPAFSDFLRQNFTFRHETADLFNARADMRLDLTCMPELETGSVDAWSSLYMLEHIPDDAAALRELYRILKPGGFGLLLVPLSLALEKTDEDPNASVEDRWRRFGQDACIRMYAKKDFVRRVEAAGFKLSQLGRDWFGADCFMRLGLPDTAVLYVVEK